MHRSGARKTAKGNLRCSRLDLKGSHRPKWDTDQWHFRILEIPECRAWATTWGKCYDLQARGSVGPQSHPTHRCTLRQTD